jgi:hypothetical protein
MNPQPTIFISSIITEFYDLRGALKYFLGKSGFRVLMSEEPDFGADCGKDVLDNCKLQIEKSDYYLLLIGNHSGTLFQIDGEKTSVTFEEFKHYISLHLGGKQLNFIAFIRKQAWDNYTKKDTAKIDSLQIKFIDELLNNSLFEDKKIGRWRYTFDKFNDIITTLETNQNGLFIDATRKSILYRTYIKREVTDIYKVFLKKKSTTGKIQSTTDFFDLPKFDHLDFIEASVISKETAVKIVIFLASIDKKDSLLMKINRVFNYIAQGEFSRFDSTAEKYILPEYIKLTIQSLEILERIFYNVNNDDYYNQIRQRNVDKFQINRGEYSLIKALFDDLKLAITKLCNLMRCFHENWYDLEKRSDSFYEYRGGIKSITDEEALKYANNYLKKQTY